MSEPTAVPGTQAPVLLYTRHTCGTIEAERARRLMAHAGLPRRQHRRPGMPHPKLAAAHAAQARRVTQALADENRWIDEGGRVDPEAIGRLHVGNEEMKRCNS